MRQPFNLCLWIVYNGLVDLLPDVILPAQSREEAMQLFNDMTAEQAYKLLGVSDRPRVLLTLDDVADNLCVHLQPAAHRFF